MIVRDFQSADIVRLAEIHAKQGFAYDLPDLDSPLFVVRKVATNGRSVPIAGAALRLTAEAFLLIDPDAEKKANVVLALHEAVRRAAQDAGLDDVQCLLPPPIEKKFGWQLMRLGWKRHEWTLYSRSVTNG